MFFMTNKRILIIIVSFAFFVFAATQCMNNDPAKKPEIKAVATKSAFAGSTSCQNCHKNISDSFNHTAHFLTSTPAAKKFIKGSFTNGKNFYTYTDKLKVVMQAKGNNFFQAAHYLGEEKAAERFDVVIGSGRKGQTYLYWRSNYLFQLPVSYYTPTNAWVNSPGYPAHEIIYDRMVPGRCMECHSTNFTEKIEDGNFAGYDRANIVYGITCEKCHGGGLEHVNFHQQNPSQKQAKYIITPSRLSNQQQIDLCGLCHSGVGTPVKPSFSFIPGDKLSDYLVPTSIKDKIPELDVHGNQYGLLLSSKCFIKSKTMTCSSCHNTHTMERNDKQLFSQRCMSCHTEANHNFCTMLPTIGASIKINCIDCHMPVKNSQQLMVQEAGKENTTPALVRSHLIGIYKEETEKLIKGFNNSSSKK
jgi:Cytochrome c554 and c-prime